MKIRIALAGNPNCGKTTLFNELTGSNQYVGNWPGVTVEKKEGNVKQYEDVSLTDLPGIYSLSPYTLEEVVARNYLVDERPDVILNIVDGTNIERNLYLTTQLIELGIPVVVAINMIDIVRKNGDIINTDILSEKLGCRVVEISALKGTGTKEAIEAAIAAAQTPKIIPHHIFSGSVEHAIAHIEEEAVHGLPEERQRWYAIKIFERDAKVLEKLGISSQKMAHIEADIASTEKEMDDDAESIITNERYDYIARILEKCYRKKNAGRLSTSDKIDKVVTNRILALPIFVVIMYLVYTLSIGTVGDWTVGFVNDQFFGDGWFALGIGRGEYDDAVGEYEGERAKIDAYVSAAIPEEINAAKDALENIDLTVDDEAIANFKAFADGRDATFATEENGEETVITAKAFDSALLQYTQSHENSDEWQESRATLIGYIEYFIPDEVAALIDAVEEGNLDAAGEFAAANPEHTGIIEGQEEEEEGAVVDADSFVAALAAQEPDPSQFGPFVPGVGDLVTRLLEKMNVQGWLQSLIVDGIVGGVGAVLGFVPQMLILFLLLSLLEDCGYMSRIAFIMDRLFRKFGLSGKSFIPMLVATGCGVPGIMASRTIEQDRDRKMTIMTTGFIPCGAKMPIVAFIAGALFGGSALVAVAAYFIGVAAVVVSGLILKKTKLFAGDPAPFVMELPAYHAPLAKNIFRATWDRGWSFVKRAGSVIVAASIIIWLLNSFSFTGGFHFMTEANGGKSILEVIGSAIAFLFAPLGFARWETAVATVLGLVAKEEVVGVFGSLSSMADVDAFAAVDGADFNALRRIGACFFDNGLQAFSFMIFNLLCAPCFAAMGAIKREMNNGKWTAFAISYMCVFAYSVSLIVYQLGSLFAGGGFGVGTAAALVVLAILIYLLLRKNKYETK